MRIGVVGCGTAGPAAAILLARQGHAVTVFDKAPVLHPVGAGLLLQPSGLAVLEGMGLREGVERSGSVVRRMHATLPAPDGRTILDLRYQDLRPDLYGIGIGRGALLHALLGAVRSAGVEVRSGEEVTAFKPVRGEAVLESNGRSLGVFDLVVIADGARSCLMPTLGIPARVRQYTWGALWCIGRRPINAARKDADTLRQVYRSTTTLIGTLPSGPIGDGNEAVSMFFSARTDQFNAIRDDLNTWKREVARLHPHAGEIASQVESAEQLLPAAYREVVMPRWHGDRFVILGDAGHALSPLLGMGANMGLVDAQTLADAVVRHGPAGAPAAYSEARRASIRAYQRMCRWMTPFFQSNLPLLAWARDLTVPPLCRWDWSRRQALLTIAGVKVGLFAAGDLPPPLPPFAPRAGAEPIFAASATNGSGRNLLTDQR